MADTDNGNPITIHKPLISDALGFSKSTEKIISCIEKACGAIYRPIGTRLEADAEAYKIKKIENAKSESKNKSLLDAANTKIDIKRIESNEKASIESRAQERKRHSEIKKLKNLDNCVAAAISDTSDDDISDTALDPNLDWLEEWIAHAERANSTDMQEMWGRILSGEIKQPGSFSIKSLTVLSKLSHEEAELFEKLCNLLCHYFDKPIIVTGSGKSSLLHQILPNSSTHIELNEFGISASSLMTLKEAGLIFTETLGFGDLSKGDEIYLSYQNNKFHLFAKYGKPHLLGYALTPVGSELSTLTTPVYHKKYEDTLITAMGTGFKIKQRSI
ncbi:TIGR03899 family protein [Paraburkholderia sediminicola]|uniref:TIGR03899 family protein n=1 Tax=Paraburkholderia sediminicola TaxID=458836 RepID=UPI0038B9234A